MLAFATSWGSAHFIWIVPEGSNGAMAKVVFSDSLEPDENVAIEKIAATKLHGRDAAGKSVPLEWKKDEHALRLQLTEPGPLVIGGTCQYGVVQRGNAKPALLLYHPKWIRGPLKDDKAWNLLPLEIVPRGAGKFVVLAEGMPAAGLEVVATPPAPGKKATLKTDAQGAFTIDDKAPGLYAIRARHNEAKAGEWNGKKYEEKRQYATLVYRVGPPADRAATGDAGAEFAPLPKGVSSFGAAAAGGHVYVYGGHSGRTHSYSTEAVTGSFLRLSVADPKKWEVLPGGPPCQGLALLAHGGRLYRIGGMQPRNKPGDKADNHSLATCDVFDPTMKKWEALPDLPAGRSSHDAIAVGDKLVVVGGWHMKGAGAAPSWHDTLLILDLGKKPLRWESVRQPFQRRALTVTAHAGKVWVLGGMNAAEGIERTVNVYDPVANTWSEGPALPGARRNGFSPAACSAGGHLYVSMGDGKVLRLNEKTRSWMEIGELKQARIVHRMVPASDAMLLVLGGAARGAGTAGNVALTEAIPLPKPTADAGPFERNASRRRN